MKRFRVILWFLLAGAVVNVGVAWEIAYYYQHKMSGKLGWAQVIHPQHGWMIGIADHTGRTFLSALVITDTSLNGNLSRDQLPYWSRALLVEPGHDHAFLDEAAYGYPFRSLSYVHFQAGDDRREVIGFPLVTRQSTRYLPLHVIWRGTALNGTLYCSALFALMMVRLTVYRVIRRLRGRCQSCGYDLRGADHLQCPECGTGIKLVKPA